MRIIAVSGGKGGIFKTGVAEAIAAWLDKSNIRWTGADTDQENKSFFDTHGSDRVRAFDVYDVDAGRLRPEQVNALVDDMDRARREGYEVYVLDQGAGQGNVLRGAMSETGLLDEIRDGSIRMTVCFVTVNTDPALSTLAANLETTFADTPSVAWIVAANEYADTGAGGVAGALRDPVLAALLARRKAQTIRVPVLESQVATAWINSHKALSAFASEGSFAERGRTKAWMGTVFAEFDRVKALLLDPDKKPLNAGVGSPGTAA